MSRSRYSKCDRLYWILLLFMLLAISIPVSGSWDVLASVLSSIPGITEISKVASFNLTQTRFSAIEILLLVAPVVFILQIFMNGHILRGSRMMVLFTILTLYIAFFAVLHYEYYTACKYSCYALAVLTVATFSQDEKQVMERLCHQLIVTAGLINSVVVVIQFAAMWEGLFSWIALRKIRPDGIMLDSILAATLNALAISVILFSRGKLESKSIAKIVLLGVSGLMTGSGAFFMLIAFQMVVFFLTSDVGKRKKRNVLWLGIFILVMLFCFVPNMQDFIVELFNSLNGSLASRNMKMKLALQLFYENPLFGVGTDQYAAYEKMYYVGYVSGLNGTNPHNIYLQVLCENGLIGFCPFIAVLIVTLFRVVRSRNWITFVILGQYLLLGFTLGITGNVRITLVLCVMCASVYRQKTTPRRFL